MSHQPASTPFPIILTNFFLSYKKNSTHFNQLEFASTPLTNFNEKISTSTHFYEFQPILPLYQPIFPNEKNMSSVLYSSSLTSLALVALLNHHSSQWFPSSHKPPDLIAQLVTTQLYNSWQLLSLSSSKVPL